ncbi:DUF1449 family protein [Rhodobacterales bacterium HKCCE2091]|nr:DUF1449 family protein [Rhodobacterales bacterium HKCCE2091]
MTILDLLIHPGLRPFEIAVGIVAGLLLLEVVVNQLGLSLMGEVEGDAGIDLDADADLDLDFDGLDAEFELDTGMSADIDPDAELSGGADTDQAGGAAGALSWLGLGAVPLSIWIAGVLTSFGVIGYVLQLAIAAVFGAPAPAWIAVLVTLLPALMVGARVARGIARLFPKKVTTAISTRSYNRRRGVITVGTARADKPAQARFTDRHGNFHYAMVVPLDSADPLPQGTEIAILRARDGTLKALRLSD